ncbi:MAG: hypothetical protein JF593_07295 [Novosphingobium sp.]|nr:hypothetical protein [Novosphingobium sp.]
MPMLPLAAAPPRSPAAALAFTPPSGPLTLVRELHRGLGDGHEIVTRRAYAVQIVPDGDGFRVDGELVDSAVEAPAILHALAELERTRSDAGLFPLHLDRAGMIVASGSPTDAGAIRQAFALSEHKIAAAPLAPAERSEAAAFIARLRTRSGAAIGGEWPADLFHPATGQHTDTRRLAVADGVSGSVTVTIDARDRPSGDLLASVERTVVTELDGTRRTSRELWTLAHR